jgi:hypothetical protein
VIFGEQDAWSDLRIKIFHFKNISACSQKTTPLASRNTLVGIHPISKRRFWGRLGAQGAQSTICAFESIFAEQVNEGSPSPRPSPRGEGDGEGQKSVGAGIALTGRADSNNRYNI